MAVQVVVGIASASLAVMWRLRWRHLYAARMRERRVAKQSHDGGVTTRENRTFPGACAGTLRFLDITRGGKANERAPIKLGVRFVHGGGGVR